MALFSYVAIDVAGQKVRGVLACESEPACRRLLKKKKLFILSLKVCTGRYVAPKLLGRFTESLRAFLESGIVCESALRLLAEAPHDKSLSRLAQQVYGGLTSGLSLAQSFESVGSFPPLYVAVIDSAEAAGTLTKALQSLDVHFTYTRTLKKELFANLLYPAFLFFVSIVSLFVLGLYVVPIFKSFLPAHSSWNIQVIFQFSDFLVRYKYVLLLGTLGVLLAFNFFRRNRSFQRVLHVLVLSLPVFKRFVVHFQMGAFLETLGLLLENGLSLSEALSKASLVPSNTLLRKQCERISKQLKRGGGFAQALEPLGLPYDVFQIVRVGEEASHLASACQKAGRKLCNETRENLKLLAKASEPVAIVCIGGLIAFIVISMLGAITALPVFE